MLDRRREAKGPAAQLRDWIRARKKRAHGRSSPTEGSVGYAVQRFPSLRTTFIRREIEELRRLGLELEVVSMRRADLEELADETEAQAHLRETEYLPDFPLDLESLRSNLRWTLRRPLTTAKNWSLTLSDAGEPGVEHRVRLALQVWRGPVMADRLERSGRCRHVHAQFSDGAATTALVAARLLDAPFSFTSHTSFASPVLAEKLSAAKFVASISEFDRGQLKRSVPAEKGPLIEIVHCGIPLENWPLRDTHCPSDPPVLLSVGALEEKKGHGILIQACNLMASEGHRFRCDIIGGGPLQLRLQRLIDDRGLREFVRLRGPLPQSEVRPALYAADAFVLACTEASNGATDGIPVSLMEAMAAGVPVVSTRMVGIPELIEDRVEGRLVPPADPRALKNALVELITNTETAEQMTSRARQKIEREYDQAGQSKKMAQIFRSVF